MGATVVTCQGGQTEFGAVSAALADLPEPGDLTFTAAIHLAGAPSGARRAMAALEPGREPA